MADTDGYDKSAFCPYSGGRVMFSLCHQLPQRSFLWLWDPPLLCARCTGFYFAILVTVTLVLLMPDRARGLVPHAIAAAFASIIVITLEKTLGLEFGNAGRCLTALPMGFAVGFGLAMPFISRRLKEEIL